MTSFIATVYVAPSRPTPSCLQSVPHRQPKGCTRERNTGLRPDRSNNRRNQFRPRPGGKQGTTSYQLRQYAEATLGGGSLRKIVKLPEGEDENEWYAVNSKHLATQPRAPPRKDPKAHADP